MFLLQNIELVSEFIMVVASCGIYLSQRLILLIHLLVLNRTARTTHQSLQRKSSVISVLNICIKVESLLLMIHLNTPIQHLKLVMVGSQNTIINTNHVVFLVKDFQEAQYT